MASEVRRMSLYAMSIVLSNFSQGCLMPNTALETIEMVGGEEKTIRRELTCLMVKGVRKLRNVNR